MGRYSEHRRSRKVMRVKTFTDRLSEALDDLVSDDPIAALDYYRESDCAEIGEAIRKYAEENGLCNECLTPLVTQTDHHPYGMGWASERVRMCPKCAA